MHVDGSMDPRFPSDKMTLLIRALVYASARIKSCFDSSKLPLSKEIEAYSFLGCNSDFRVQIAAGNSGLQWMEARGRCEGGIVPI